MRYWLRARVRDRPGSLGALALAVASVGANIVNVEVLDRTLTHAVDDVMLELPSGLDPAMVRDAVGALGGVEVESLRPLRETGGHAHLDLLNAVVNEPARAAATATDMAPDAFRADWAIGLDVTVAGWVVHASIEAPVAAIIAAPWLPVNRARSIAADGWFDTAAAGLDATPAMAVCRLGPPNTALLLGRTAGPVFHPLELFRLESVCQLLDSVVRQLPHVRRSA